MATAFTPPATPYKGGSSRRFAPLFIVVALLLLRHQPRQWCPRFGQLHQFDPGHFRVLFDFVDHFAGGRVVQIQDGDRIAAG